MSEATIRKINTWIPILTIVASVMGAIGAQKVQQSELNERIARAEKRMDAINDERSSVLVAIGRLEERIKSIQEQLNKEKR